MPKHDYIKQLIENVEYSIESFANSSRDAKAKTIWVEKIREEFYMYFVSLFKNYKKYTNEKIDEREIKDDIRNSFKEAEYIAEHSKTDFFRFAFVFYNSSETYSKLSTGFAF